MRLAWSPEAVDDLVHVRNHIARDDPVAAKRVVVAIVNLVEDQLPRFPNSGREGRVAGTRELVVPGLPFVVPYRVKERGVEILRVYHTSRRWPDSL